MGLLPLRSEPKYTTLESPDNESRGEDPESQDNSSFEYKSTWARLKPNFFYYLYVFSILVFCIVIFVVFNHLAQHASGETFCINPGVRGEWRALSPKEQQDFIHAIQCTSKTPSSWMRNSTIYDDIAALHAGIGSWCHRSACLLPWHRYILSVIESILHDHCGYQGLIPYWDWSLDWMDLANSSIWNNETGFGGDGDPDGPETVGEGGCLTDGPFANLRPARYNHTHIVHCLSRGFRDGDIKGRLPGKKFSPENLGDILQQGNYTSFLQRVERDLHNTLHNSINGDFRAMTAANGKYRSRNVICQDPLFFLHHVNLDRLWWKWQQEDSGNRLFEYSGQHMFNSTGLASINDVLMFGRFTDDIVVRFAMSTQRWPLCYTY